MSETRISELAEVEKIALADMVSHPWGAHARVGSLTRRLILLQGLIKAYLDARDNCNPEGERLARLGMEKGGLLHYKPTTEEDPPSVLLIVAKDPSSQDTWTVTRKRGEEAVTSLHLSSDTLRGAVEAALSILDDIDRQRAEKAPTMVVTSILDTDGVRWTKDETTPGWCCCVTVAEDSGAAQVFLRDRVASVQRFRSKPGLLYLAFAGEDVPTLEVGDHLTSGGPWTVTRKRGKEAVTPTSHSASSLEGSVRDDSPIPGEIDQPQLSEVERNLEIAEGVINDLLDERQKLIGEVERLRAALGGR